MDSSAPLDSAFLSSIATQLMSGGIMEVSGKRISVRRTSGVGGYGHDWMPRYKHTLKLAGDNRYATIHAHCFCTLEIRSAIPSVFRISGEVSSIANVSWHVLQSCVMDLLSPVSCEPS